MGRFAIVNIGCKVNRVEADTAAAALLASGWERSDLPEADLILVNDGREIETELRRFLGD